MSDLDAGRLATAALYLLWAICYGSMLQIVWTHLRARRRGWLNHAFGTLNRLAVLYYGPLILLELTPTEFHGRCPGFHAFLHAASNLSLVLMAPLFRHMVTRIPVVRERLSRRWLSVTYGAALPGMAAAVLPLVLPSSEWLAVTLVVHAYVLLIVWKGLRDMKRLERRGAWPARSRPDVRVGALLMTVGWGCVFLGGAGVLASAIGAGSSVRLWLPILRSGMGLAIVAPYAVRILEQVLRRMVVALAMLAATALYVGMQALAAHQADVEVGRILMLLAVWWIAILLAPGQALLRRLVDRVVLGQSRRRQDELRAALQDVSPEFGVEGCCERALAEVAKVMQLRGAALAVADVIVAHGDFPLEALRRVWPLGAGPDRLPAGTFTPRELADPALAAMLLDHGIMLVVPIVSPERCWGHLLAIPGRMLGTLLSEEDIQTLEAFADQLTLVLSSATLLARAVAVERSLAHVEKLAAVGETAARIAHEIRNPVTAARSLAQQMGQDPTSPLNAEHAALMLGELERVERQVAALLRFSRREDFRFTAVDLGELVSATVATVRSRLSEARITVEVDAEPVVVARADREKLRQLLLNLIENAADALGEVTSARSLRLAVTGTNGTATISVTDNGPGVPPDVLAQLFEPFFSLKENGTGLGLAIARRTVQAHGGGIEAEGAPGAGLTIRVTLPVAGGGA